MKWWNEPTDNWGGVVVMVGYILMLIIGLVVGFLFGFSKGFLICYF